MVDGMLFRANQCWCQSSGASVRRCGVGTCWTGLGKSQDKGLVMVLWPAGVSADPAARAWEAASGADAAHAPIWYKYTAN